MGRIVDEGGGMYKEEGVKVQVEERTTDKRDVRRTAKEWTHLPIITGWARITGKRDGYRSPWERLINICRIRL